MDSNLRAENRMLKEQLVIIANDNEELKEENEKLTNLWLDCQMRRMSAIEYIKENANYDISIKQCRDNLFDCECDDLLELLGDKEDE